MYLTKHYLRNADHNPRPSVKSCLVLLRQFSRMRSSTTLVGAFCAIQWGDPSGCLFKNVDDKKWMFFVSKRAVCLHCRHLWSRYRDADSGKSINGASLSESKDAVIVTHFIFVTLLVQLLIWCDCNPCWTWGDMGDYPHSLYGISFSFFTIFWSVQSGKLIYVSFFREKSLVR